MSCAYSLTQRRQSGLQLANLFFIPLQSGAAWDQVVGNSVGKKEPLQQQAEHL